MATKKSSSESHIANTKNLISAAQKFVNNPKADKTLASSAEAFITSAEAHVAHTQAMVYTRRSLRTAGPPDTTGTARKRRR